MAIIRDYTAAEAGGGVAATILYGGGATVAGQSVQPASPHKVTLAKFTLAKNGSPTGNAFAKIYATTGTHGSTAVHTGAALATSDALNVATIPSIFPTMAPVTLNFSGANQIDLEPGVTYALLFEYSGGDASNYVDILFDTVSPADAGNMIYVHTGTTYTYTDFDVIYSLEGTLLAPPVASFNASATSGNAFLNVTFTDTSTNTPTSWLWDFDDGTTSTSQNPSHSFATGVYDVTLTATNADGTDVSSVTTISVNQALVQGSTLSNPPTLYAPTLTTSDPAPPPPTDWSALGKEDEKEYLYKVYDKDDNYIGIWQDVLDLPQFTERINEPGTNMVVKLGRSANTTIQQIENLTDEAANQYVDDAGNPYVSTDTILNTIGAGTDVDLGYKIKVYVTYGGFDFLVDEEGNQYVDASGNAYITSYGAPLGRPIFQGFILDYSAEYGDVDKVSVTLVSHGYELNHEVIRDGAVTTVTYDNAAPEDVFMDILDTNPGEMTYSASTIDATGETADFKFQLNTKLQGLESAFRQTPAGFYWYGNVAENAVYLKEASTTPDHVFILGKHIKNIAVRRTLEGLVNDVYFVGGNTTPGDDTTMVFKHYEDAASQTSWGNGLKIITDRRFTDTTSIANYANREIDEASEPVYTTPVTITAGRYDIEEIRIGQMVGFANFGNFIDDLVLQIVSRSYSATQVTIELGKRLEREVDLAASVDESLSNEQFSAIPTTPS